MPIYEYQCEECDHELEALQKMSDDALVDCPNCEKPGLRKLVSASAFRLKGSGWYETDFKSDKQKNLATDDKSSSASSEATKSSEKGAATSDTGSGSNSTNKSSSSSGDSASTSSGNSKASSDTKSTTKSTNTKTKK
ncbi:MAG: zinc ribbon domain-containing protein [Pseudomonadales bacterium]|nr:zinc ribbon domain-containing protein [Pseudomonadales bacterium]